MLNVFQNSDLEFVDTNIFVYAEDRREPVKRGIALSLIERLSKENRLVVSAQVINEFCAVLFRGKVRTATQEDMFALIEEMESIAIVAPLTLDLTRDAIRASYSCSISWYDALIWAAAKSSNCTTIYTEDTPGVQVFEGVRYINPFQPQT